MHAQSRTRAHARKKDNKCSQYLATGHYAPAWCHIVETIQWPRYKYRVGTLRDGNGTALGAVVRLKARLNRQRAFGARIGTLRTMRCRQYEIRDRKDRCVLCILGPIELVQGTGWAIDSLNAPVPPHIQHYMICSPV